MDNQQIFNNTSELKQNNSNLRVIHTQNDNDFLIDEICINNLELINSSKFSKIFERILNCKIFEKINSKYYINILDKILFKNKFKLSEKEKNDFLKLIKSKEFQDLSQQYYSRLKSNKNIKEIGQFLKRFTVESITSELIKETTIKRVCSLFEEQKDIDNKKGKTKQLTNIKIQGNEFSIISKLIQEGKRNLPLKVKDKINDRYVALSTGKKMYYIDLIDTKELGGKFDYVGGGIEIDDKFYFKIQDGDKSYIYADNKIIGPFPNISNIRKISNEIIANIIISNNNTVINIQTKEIYYIDKKGILRKKNFEMEEDLLEESYYNSFKIEDFKIDGNEKLKTAVLFCYFRGQNGFLKSLNKKISKWRKDMHAIKIKGNEITYKYEHEFSSWFSIFLNGKFKV